MSPSLPKSYKAAIFQSAGAPCTIVERPLKLPGQGEILVKSLACGVCHSDAAVKYGSVPLPKIPGHELIGDVVAVGPGEQRFKIGDRVGGGWHGGHCGTCLSCRSGDFVTCQNQNINGFITDGGYAEYVILRTEAVVAVPADMDPAEAAPLLCAGVTTFNSLRNMPVRPGDVVAVQGIGGLGHLAIQFARKMGYHVVALSQSGSKRDLALKLGAHDYLDASKVDQVEELNKLGGVKVAVCTAPNSEVIGKLLNALAPSGVLLLLAIAENVVIANSLPMVQKRLSICGWPSGTAKDSEDTLNFARLQDIHCMIEKFSLDQADEAFQRMMSGKVNFRCVITF